MIKKLKNFFKYDIRIKLKKISYLTGISFYPNFFSFRGIKRFYHYLIFEMIFFSKTFKKRKILKNKLKNEIISNFNKKNNVLVSSPASGSTFIRSCLYSYFEIYLKIGNGIPKYDNINNLWLFTASPFIQGGDLYNFVNLDLPSSNPSKKRLFWSDEFFDKNKIFFTRYPFGHLDLLEQSKIRPVILFREPKDWMVSYYISQMNEYKNNNLSNEINEFLIKHSLKRIKSYYDHWNNYSIKYNECLFIEFNSLNKNPNEVFKKICLYFELDISDNDILNKCVEYNSKDFLFKYLGATFHGTRFTKEGQKEKIGSKIEPYIEKAIKDLKVDESYLNLFKKRNEIL